MVKHINVAVSDDVHSKLEAEKEERGASWPELFRQLSVELREEN